MLGDSWVEGKSYRPNADGTGVDNGPGFEHMAFLTARLLNAAPIIGGIGGTGYVNRYPNSHYGVASRMDRLIGHQPDMVLVFGSINDGANSGVEAAALEVYGRIANELPGVPVLVCATQDYGEGAPAATAPNPGHGAAAAASPNVAGHVEPNVENWVTSAHAGLVNNSYDNAHLTTFGNRLYAEKLAAFIAASLGITA
ncbi:GDSL-type esterase/lipase family protein [Neomicrococcus aestuarii]|uniref:GDSL-type esterase/lipase family protein n=1 Tax=Neomicrococcus aestuarii TaxID=556325 RepID=UPI003908A288